MIFKIKTVTRLSKIKLSNKLYKIKKMKVKKLNITCLQSKNGATCNWILLIIKMKQNKVINQRKINLIKKKNKVYIIRKPKIHSNFQVIMLLKMKTYKTNPLKLQCYYLDAELMMELT